MTAEGPRLIDWTWTRRAGPALDLGHCHVVLCELMPENHDDPERPRALNAAVQSEYARLAGMSPVALPSTEPFSFLFPTLERSPYRAGALAFLRGKLQGTFSSNIPRHIKTFRRRPTLACSATDLAFAFTRYSRSLRRLNPPSIVALWVGHSRGARS